MGWNAKFLPCAVFALVALATSLKATAADYHVGPGQALARIGDVPWYALQAGDTVFIHYQASPYHEKFLISGRGTSSQWIRVLGVPGPNGELPIISGNGATTSSNMHYHWQDATGDSAIQWDGVIQIAVHADDSSGSAPLPGYIEIANLQVQDGFSTYSFTAENGQTAQYDGFAACIYARSAQHILIRNNILTNCGQGFYNWTGDGSAEVWWSGLERDTVLRGNYFYNNGNPDSYTEHQTYTESDGVIIEYNRYGPQRTGALGSQLKDRSAGTVVRYNYIEQSLAGWDVDLVEPQEGCPSLCYSSGATVAPNPKYLQTFVHGNVIVNRTNSEPDFVHWNEDHYMGQGRATEPNGRLYFYNNTIISTTDADLSSLFNETYGGFDCPTTALSGRIVMTNNILYSTATSFKLGEYCNHSNSGIGYIDFGANWVSPGYALQVAAGSTGSSNLFSPANNIPGFINLSTNDYHLAATSSAIGKGSALPAALTTNYLGLDLTPTYQYVYPTASATLPSLETRPQFGVGSDLGAFELQGPGRLSIQATRKVSEGAAYAKLRVDRTSGSIGAIGVDYATSNGAALAGTDYTTIGGTLAWADGDGNPKFINVPILHDTTTEPTKTFTVTLSNATGSASLGNAISTVTITDDDPSTPFADTAGSAFLAYINAIAGAGITTGCGSGNYCPSQNVTREQMAAFIIRAVEGEPAACASAPFTDVATGSAFCKYIKRMLELNITTGCGNSNYCPSQNVDRQQMAAFIVRAVEGNPVPGYCGSTSPFGDVLPSSSFCGPIKRLLELNITTGCGNGNYCPTQSVTRDQMAAFLARAFLGM
jgi:hypothetical protein